MSGHSKSKLIPRKQWSSLFFPFFSLSSDGAMHCILLSPLHQYPTHPWVRSIYYARNGCCLIQYLFFAGTTRNDSLNVWQLWFLRLRTVQQQQHAVCQNFAPAVACWFMVPWGYHCVWIRYAIRSTGRNMEDYALCKRTALMIFYWGSLTSACSKLWFLWFFGKRLGWNGVRPIFQWTSR